MSADRHKGRSARQAELEKLAAMADEDIDTSDAPEIRNAEVGKFYRPIKKQITLRLDADVLAWFKAKGAGYQSAINRVLREHADRKHAKRRT